MNYFLTFRLIINIYKLLNTSFEFFHYFFNQKKISREKVILFQLIIVTPQIDTVAQIVTPFLS